MAAHGSREMRPENYQWIWQEQCHGVVGAESLDREGSREKRKEWKAVNVGYSFEEFCYEGNKEAEQKPLGEVETGYFVLCCFLRLEGR